MSLVDYASSDEDEETQQVKEEEEVQHHHPKEILPQSQPQPNIIPSNAKQVKSSRQHSNNSVHQPEPSILRLPDASLLFDSPAVPSNPGGFDHSSRVAAAMAENASRKRESKESTSTSRQSKVPRGSLPHSRGIPDIVGGLLRPPQLSGRSNVVTEDISKLFVKKAEPSSN